jgi:hypothetical protein
MAGRIDPSADADIRFFCGATGSGKTFQMQRAAKPARRLLVFDPDDEYADALGLARYTSPARAAKAAPRQLTGWRVAIAANGSQSFEAFCALAWALGDARNPLTVVVDELAGVTSPAKAAGAWHSLVTRARKYRTTLIAGAQAPAEVDKTVMRQRTYLWVGRLERPADHRYIAEETGIEQSTLKSLRGKPRFDAIEKHAGSAPRCVPRTQRRCKTRRR